MLADRGGAANDNGGAHVHGAVKRRSRRLPSLQPVKTAVAKYSSEPRSRSRSELMAERSTRRDLAHKRTNQRAKTGPRQAAPRRPRPTWVMSSAPVSPG